jgi:hypothetical protein
MASLFASSAKHVRHIWPASPVRTEGSALKGIAATTVRRTTVAQAKVGVAAITRTGETPTIHFPTSPIEPAVAISALLESVPALFQSKGTGGLALHVTERLFHLIKKISVGIRTIHTVNGRCGEIPNARFGIIVDQGGDTIQPKVMWKEAVIVRVAKRIDLGLEQGHDVGVVRGGDGP